MPAESLLMRKRLHTLWTSPYPFYHFEKLAISVSHQLCMCLMALQSFKTFQTCVRHPMPEWPMHGPPCSDHNNESIIMNPKKRTRGGKALRSPSPPPAPPPAQPPQSPPPPPATSPSINAVPTSPQDAATQFVPATQDNAPPPLNPGAPAQESLDNVATFTPDQTLAEDSSPGDRRRVVMRAFPHLDSPQKNLIMQLTLDVSRDRAITANVAC